MHFLFVPYSQGWETFSLIIRPNLLRELPRGTQLTACATMKQPKLEGVESCLVLDTWISVECTSCSLQAPDVINEFERVCVVCNCLAGRGNFELYGKPMV